MHAGNSQTRHISSTLIRCLSIIREYCWSKICLYSMFKVISDFINTHIWLQYDFHISTFRLYCFIASISLFLSLRRYLELSERCRRSRSTWGVFHGLLWGVPWGRWPRRGVRELERYKLMWLGSEFGGCVLEARICLTLGSKDGERLQRTVLVGVWHCGHHIFEEYHLSNLYMCNMCVKWMRTFKFSISFNKKQHFCIYLFFAGKKSKKQKHSPFGLRLILLLTS